MHLKIFWTMPMKSASRVKVSTILCFALKQLGMPEAKGKKFVSCSLKNTRYVQSDMQDFYLYYAVLFTAIHESVSSRNCWQHQHCHRYFAAHDGLN